MSEIDSEVYRMVAVFSQIEEMSKTGFRLTPDLEEMQQLGADLQEIMGSLLEYAKSGKEIPECWRNLSVGRWTGPWQADDV